ncbi:MAG: hypothetical protein II909_04735 [Kiritimatiellae bacterium]|nr:hypothetical protein [Kiritimatiellia bacterium]
MIPKKLHYVWLGNGEKPDVFKRCLESWREFCPDYEIKEWGDEELRKSGNRFALEAAANRKFAFASDFLRLKALYDEGGFYCDTDCEILRPLDKFLNEDFVCCNYKTHGAIWLNTAFIGCAPENPLIGGLLASYADKSMIDERGELDLAPNSCEWLSIIEEKFHVSFADAVFPLKLGERMTIYPSDYFCDSRDGYAFHHLTGTWVDAWQRKLILRFGRYRFCKFVHKSHRKGSEKVLTPELRVGERCLCSLRIGRKKFFMLLAR